MADIPQLPKIAIEGIITNEAGKRLLQWVELFQKIGVNAYIDGDDSGISVNCNDGDVMLVMLDGLPINADDAPFAQGLFHLNGLADLYMTETTIDWDEWMQKLKTEKAPITSESFIGTWEEVYRKIAEYLQFREKMIPHVPKDLLES